MAMTELKRGAVERLRAIAVVLRLGAVGGEHLLRLAGSGLEPDGQHGTPIFS